ncbi:MAG: amidohydrolase [Pseudomonadota bacterium]
MPAAPEIVILDGRLITFDPTLPVAEALAIQGGRIVAVGSTADIRDMASGAQVIDAGGGTVLPGFVDSHVHLFNGSAELDYLNLHGVTTARALTEAVNDYAAARPDEPIIFASAAGYDAYDGQSPTRHDLDRILPDRAFAYMASDHHTVWANTKALQAAGLLHGAPMPEGSEVVMGPDGLASGELRETGAFGPIMKLTKYGGRDLLGYVTGDDPDPPATAAERAADRAVITRGMAHCARKGITGLHNMDGNFYQLELLQEMDKDRILLCRTEVPMHLKNYDPLDRIDEAVDMRRAYASDMVWSGRVKMFMDGVIDSRTALMLRPYPGTETYGDPVFSAEHFNAAAIRADAAGLQISAHAIGDAAVRRTLDGYEAAQAANGVRDSRHRIEHIEVIHPDDLPRLAALGTVASIQPMHAPAGGYFPPYEAGDVLHADQLPYAFAWNRIRETGVPIIFSTDWPVVPVDVMPSIRAAVAPLSFGPAWEGRAQTLRDTFWAMTAGAAWVEFNEHRKGQLRAGMMADVVIMSHDLEALHPEELTEAHAAVTICGGRITHEG